VRRNTPSTVWEKGRGPSKRGGKEYEPKEAQGYPLRISEFRQGPLTMELPEETSYSPRVMGVSGKLEIEKKESERETGVKSGVRTGQ